MGALSGLDSAVALACSYADVSTARARQLRWVAGELRRAADLTTFSGPFHDTEFLAAYLRLADAGQLRARSSARTVSTDATRRVRRDCLNLLLHAARRPALPREDIPIPRQREPVAPEGLHTLVAALRVAAARPDALDLTVRAAALVALVADTGARPGALASLRVDDVDLEQATVVLTETPPAARTPQLRVARLSAATVATLRTWLARRDDLVADKTGVHTLFVSVHGNHDGTGSTRRPAGLPLQPRGLARAYAALVADTNYDFAGWRGFPLPRTLGPLRAGARAAAARHDTLPR